jgi:hypothetical protein
MNAWKKTSNDQRGDRERPQQPPAKSLTAEIRCAPGDGGHPAATSP